jgi:transcriptional regulator NrdR family protein
MTPSLETGVERRMESPSDEATVRLIVEVTTQSDEVREQLVRIAETVHNELPMDCYSLTIAEVALSDLADLQSVTRIEFDSEATKFESEQDFCYPTG